MDFDDFAILDAAANGPNSVLSAPPAGPNDVNVSWVPSSQGMAVNWDADAVTGETGWRVQRSLDGVDFGQWYVNVPGNAGAYVDADALPEGSRVYYRVRAYGNGQETAYTPKAYALTPLPAPVLSPGFLADARGLEVDVTWADNSLAETGFVIELTELDAGGQPLSTRTIDDVPANDGPTATYTLTGLKPNTSYSVRVKALNGTTESTYSPTETFFSDAAVLGGWTKVMDWNRALYWDHASFDLDVHWDYNDLSNRIDTIEISGLPKHTYAGVTIRLSPSGQMQPQGQVTVSVSGTGGPSRTWHAGDPSDIDTEHGHLWVLGGDASDGDPDDSGVFRHTDSTLSIQLAGEGFSEFAYAEWLVEQVEVRTYFPGVSIAGGTALGENSPGPSSLTLTRTGEGEAIEDPLAVNLALAGTASRGSDYQIIRLNENGLWQPVGSSVEIPAGQASLELRISAIDDDETEAPKGK